MTVEPHEHVTIDEAVLHAYQDLAWDARRLVRLQPGISLDVLIGDIRRALSALDAALDRSVRNNDVDRLHHTRPALPLHRTQANYGVSCSTCDDGGCPDCTDPA